MSDDELDKYYSEWLGDNPGHIEDESDEAFDELAWNVVAVWGRVSSDDRGDLP